MAGLGAWLRSKVTPPSLADVERETRAWTITCRTCGRSRDLWDSGGKRYGGGAKRVVLGRCAGCADRLRTMDIERRGA